MAKFLTTTATSFHIENIIIESQKSITLVAPFLKLTPILIDRLKDAEKQNITITIIYGKNDLIEDQKRILYKFENIEIYFCQNLHAKCYYNEKSLVITSMNLYEFSERNNREMGILIDKNLDSEIYLDTLKEIQSIKNSSKLEKKIIANHKETVVPTVNKETVIATVHKETTVLNVDESYNELENFHLPLLHKRLKIKFPKIDILLEKEITILDFPLKGIDTNISRTIDFRFNDKNLFDNFKYAYGRWLGDSPTETRFYWNHYRLSVYPPSNFEISLDPVGRNKKVEHSLEVINKVYEMCTKSTSTNSFARSRWNNNRY